MEDSILDLHKIEHELAKGNKNWVSIQKFEKLRSDPFSVLLVKNKNSQKCVLIFFLLFLHALRRKICFGEDS